MIIDFWTNKNKLYTKVFAKTYNAKTRYVLSYGGSGSSKSWSEAQNEIIKSFKLYGGNVLVVRKTFATLEVSCFELLKSIIYQCKLERFFKINKSPLTIENLVTGKKFIFKGLDDIEKVKSIANIQRVWIEEANEITASDFRELDRRIRGFRDIQIVLLLNPVSEHHWIKRYFIDGEYAPLATVIHSTYKDNKFVGAEYGERMEAYKNIDQNEYNVYCLGNWGVISAGLVFKGWKSVDVFPSDMDFWYGLDFGYTNDPTAIVRIAYNKKFNELYLDEVCYKTKLDNNMIAEVIKEDYYNQYHLIYEDFNRKIYSQDGCLHIEKESVMLKEMWADEERLIKLLIYYNFDSKQIKIICREVKRLKKPKNVYCDSAEPKSIAEMKGYGIEAYATLKGAGSIMTGIQKIQHLKMFYTRSSKNINKEVMNYAWVKDKKTDKYINEAVDKDNHLMDATRYGIFTHFTRNKWL